MAKITISQSNQAGEVPTWEMKKKEIFTSEFIEDVLRLSDDKVFVCFQKWSDQIDETDCPSIFVTNSFEDALLFMDDFIEIIKGDEIDFNFFCFPNYQEAFAYCINLKRGY